MTHVLIVDDEFDNQTLLQEILSDYGITSASATSIDEAVASASMHTFDAVLMDMTLPQQRYGNLLMLGGVEATRTIRSQLGDKSPPFIAVTAQGMPENYPKILAAGISQIVEKSIDLENRVVRAMEIALGRSLSQQQPQFVAVQSTSTALAENSIAAESPCGGTPTFQPNEPIPNRTPNTQQLRPDRVSLPASEPLSVEELQDRVRQRLELATVLLDQLAKESEEADSDIDHRRSILTLRSNLGDVIRRLQSSGDGPRPGEPYGHWIVNLLIGVARGASKLLAVDQHDHFGKYTHILQSIKQHIDSSILLGKSDVGRRSTEAEPTAGLDSPEEGMQSGAELRPSPCGSDSDGNSLPQTPDPRLPLKNKRGLIQPIEVGPKDRLILIVDDEPEPRRDLEDKLRQLGYRAISCDNSQTALVFLESQRVDVCLVDLDMPGINGLELIERIRRSSMSANASIIVVSGSSEAFAAAEAIEKGADDYLEKPADERLLKARIKSCLRHSDARLSELCKFLPFDVVQRVLSNRDLLEKPMPADISVMVCDVRGFSQISERVGPVRTIEWISDVMNRLSQIILNRGGTIIDYVGDEIMAMWGAPIASQTHASDACECAIAVQQVAEQLSENWLPIIGTRLRIGIGINSGLAVVGNTGSKQRIKYGPLGNTVNMASRVQGATKYLQSSVLMTEDTASRIDGKLKGRRICAVRVQNINEPVRLFELAIGDSGSTSSRNALYQSALEAFENESLSDALALTAKLLTESPDDGPAKLLMMRVIQCQLGDSFDPVWTLPGK